MFATGSSIVSIDLVHIPLRSSNDIKGNVLPRRLLVCPLLIWQKSERTKKTLLLTKNELQIIKITFEFRIRTEFKWIADDSKCLRWNFRRLFFTYLKAKHFSVKSCWGSVSWGVFASASSGPDHSCHMAVSQNVTLSTWIWFIGENV